MIAQQFSAMLPQQKRWFCRSMPTCHRCGIRRRVKPVYAVYVSAAIPDDLMNKGTIKVKGSGTEAARRFNLFERDRPEKVVLIRPTPFGFAR